MIKVNLLLVKKKKKAKPLPTFLLVAIVVAFAAVALVIYLNFSFTGRVNEKKAKVAENARTLDDLEKKIKAVDDFEKLNADFKKRKGIIEELGKNKTLPVKLLDEISRILPDGVWLTQMSITGNSIALTCTGFNNTDVVNFVNNLKGSSLLTDVFLQESVQGNAGGFSLYNFKVTCKVKS
jgi:type IV pilus assembly protein PilN